jgi:thiol-disulfide isomerase/thioredoxin
MTFEQPARAPEKKIWTGARVASAALVFTLLAAALSSSCNPTDSSRTGSKAAPPTPAATVPASSPPSQTAQQPRPAQPSPTPLPDELLNASLTTLDGKSLKLSEFKGKVVVLNMWATWCGPCRREIPDFIEIQKDYEGRVEVLGITSEDERNTAESVKEFVKDFKINYKVVWVDATGWEAFLAPRYSIPQTYVLGTDGNLINKFVGYSPQVATMVRQIADESLAGSPASGAGGETTQ